MTFEDGLMFAAGDDAALVLQTREAFDSTQDIVAAVTMGLGGIEPPFLRNVNDGRSFLITSEW